MLHAFLAEDADTAYATARPPLLRYFRSSVDISRGFAAAQGLSVRPEDLSEEDMQTLLEHGLERYLRHGGLFGTPDTCVPVLDMVRELGVDEVAALVDFGTSLEDTLSSIRLLGDLVERERSRAAAAAATAATRTADQVAALARAVADHDADTVAGPADALAWLAEHAPHAVTGRVLALADDAPPSLLECLRHAGARVALPGPDGLRAWWCGGPGVVIDPAAGGAGVRSGGCTAAGRGGR